MIKDEMQGVTHHYKGSRTRSVRCPDGFDRAAQLMIDGTGKDFGKLCREALMQCWPQYFDETLQREEVKRETDPHE